MLTLSLLLKLPPRELVPWLILCSFFTDVVALYFFKSTMQPWMEYCFLVWTGAPSCYLDILDKLQKWVWRTVGHSLAASLELLGSSLKCYQLKPFRKIFLWWIFIWTFWIGFSCGRSICYSDRLHDFSVVGIIHDYFLMLKSF